MLLEFTQCMRSLVSTLQFSHAKSLYIANCLLLSSSWQLGLEALRYAPAQYWMRITRTATASILVEEGFWSVDKLHDRRSEDSGWSKIERVAMAQGRADWARSISFEFTGSWPGNPVSRSDLKMCDCEAVCFLWDEVLVAMLENNGVKHNLLLRFAAPQAIKLLQGSGFSRTMVLPFGNLHCFLSSFTEKRILNQFKKFYPHHGINSRKL